MFKTASANFSTSFDSMLARLREQTTLQLAAVENVQLSFQQRINESMGAGMDYLEQQAESAAQMTGHGRAMKGASKTQEPDSFSFAKPA